MILFKLRLLSLQSELRQIIGYIIVFSLWGLSMKTSARNQLQGQITQLKKGAVNAEVVMRLDGGEEITAIITNTSVERLGLKEGGNAYALIKASDVILAVDG